ncbi:hypothetical protein C2845_PM04G16760 [Panicum miliaceum]|uniref:Alpha-galactosidase n=1 Tax=Panicum miliaceum TaxID=4540 RepID=A0A3L6QRB5_PANMI|nr:hypothetical protein C2845_PM04G16760 [Panicum miliaceum]
MVDSGLAKLGYDYINIDDCWAAYGRDSQGNLVANPSTFPSGIKVLADYVHGKELKLGVYGRELAAIRCLVRLDMKNKTLKPSHHGGVNDPATWASGVGNSWRTTGYNCDEEVCQFLVKFTRNRVQQDGDQEVWAGPLSRGRVAVVLWNRGSAEASVTASWSSIGLNASTVVDAHNLWTNEITSSVQGELKETVDTHACKIASNYYEEPFRCVA